MPQVQPTQRAYTLRLRGADKDDTTWRDALWATHEAVNNGAKVFGDWLLTLRGGLDHRLADEKINVKGGKGKPDREPTTEERRDRRVLLALSWLSVESAPNESDAYKAFVIASGKDDSQSSRNQKVVCALRGILEKRDVKGAELGGWIADCEPSLSAAIRDDAVWVNRSDAFDMAQQRVGPSLTREEVWNLLEPFFGSRETYLAPLKTAEDSDTDSAAAKDKAKDLVQKAGQWLSSRFGTGKGADFAGMSRVYAEIAAWAQGKSAFHSGSAALTSLAESLSTFHPEPGGVDGILNLISGPGYKSATRNIIKAWETRSGQVTVENVAELRTAAEEDANKCRTKTGGKGRRPWSDAILHEVELACGFTYLQANGPARHCEFSVMLDHAARRASIGHSWIKRAESERQKFKVNAEKRHAVPSGAKAWLDQFCEDRSGTSGALDAYRIRKRAVEGWREVVAKWGRGACKTAEDRVAAAREAQADPDIDKFGDIQLFEALAEDEAVCVWRVNGETTAQPLIDYTAATDAEAKQRRFKVPAYRHPDLLAHPVFCDFGSSRWDIRFAVHDAASKLDDARQTVARRESELVRAKSRFGKAKTPEKQTQAQDKAGQCEKDLSEARKRLAWLSSRHALSMGLWTGGSIDSSTPLFWSGKRLTDDLALRHSHSEQEVTPVARADRLGRAAVGAKDQDRVSPSGLFELDDWNGRLQAPRGQLDAIAKHVAKHGWDAKAKRMRDRVRWLVSFSAKLQPAGPWIGYGNQHRLHDTKQNAIVLTPRSEKDEWRGLAFPFWHPDNQEGRKGHSKHLLSRLPGLRVLSVDLGHRYAAACAVWETLTTRQVQDACQAANHAPPVESDLFLHLATMGEDGKTRTTIYRRVGADTIIDPKSGEVAPHPAPWAQLERQFLIKLQGEDRRARAASNKGDFNEVRLLGEFAQRLGLNSENDRDKAHAVDELMARAIRIAALGLKRHSRRAKIAYALDPAAKSAPGMGGRETVFQPGDETHTKLLTDALLDWYSLASESKWNDKAARELWNLHVAPMNCGWSVAEPHPGDQAAEGSTRQQRRKDEDALRERLKPLAKELAQADRTAIHLAWRKRWGDDDGPERNRTDFEHQVTKDDKGRNRSTTTAKRDTSGWHADLRWLTDWIMGWHLRGEEGLGWTRNLGGLSLTRIATMKSLYQLHKAFAMRPKPDQPRGAPEKGESNAGVAQSILDAMERMREQRVKQLASRIAEAVLGIGREHLMPTKNEPNRKCWCGKMHGNKKDPKRPRNRVDAPCHAVVIENLTNYRPEETRTRRENRQLMTWSSSKVKKYLSEACQLHGLHLREVQAGYTSRQDSRTGAPGVRCADVAVEEFMTAPWWRKQVRVAKKKDEKDGGSTRDRYLLALEEACGKIPQEKWKEHRPLRIPVSGGELFVSAEACQCCQRKDRKGPQGLQADLNAAANIGLKAILDPDWPGKWWYVPAALDDGWRIPDPKSCGGATCLERWKVAQDHNGYSPTGKPLQLTDNEGLKKAEEAVNQAKAALDATEKALKTAKKTRKAADIEAATARRDEAKQAHQEAKKAYTAAKKGASAKEVVNLWRDPVSNEPACFAAGGVWREYAAYKQHVECRVIEILREQAGLATEQPGLSSQEETPF